MSDTIRGMDWREISLPALSNILSTGEAQPLARDQWPKWARDTPAFTGAWFTPLDAPLNVSTGTLASSGAQAYVDMERRHARPPTYRYARYVYCQMVDGRTFQLGPLKELEYERHREERPPWFESYRSTST
jgi:hypothetical protein